MYTFRSAGIISYLPNILSKGEGEMKLMALTISGATVWFSDDMEEQVVVSGGEYILLNVNTRRAEKLGTTIEAALETLRTLGKYEDFSGLGQIFNTNIH